MNEDSPFTNAQVDTQTGEVNDVATALLNYDPVSPVEVEALIRELADRLEDAVPTIKRLWEERYEAERLHIKTRASAMLNAPYSSVTEKRAHADLTADPFLKDFQTAKAILHAAEELQKALTAKLYGYLNLNKGLQSSFQGYGHGRT